VTQGFVLKGNLDRRDFCDTPVFNPLSKSIRDNVDAFIKVEMAAIDFMLGGLKFFLIYSVPY